MLYEVITDWLTDKGMMDVDGCNQVVKAPGVFAIGDTIKPGLLTHAIGMGREAAEQIDDYLVGRELVPKKKPPMISQECLSKELFRPHNRSRFNFTDATRETSRCISCGTCRDCGMCLEACPVITSYSIHYTKLYDARPTVISATSSSARSVPTTRGGSPR